MKKLILFVILSAVSLSAQNTQILSQVGDVSITGEEFKRRYELSPNINTGRDQDSVKREFLYTLIAEKLWANEARKRMLDTTDYVRYSVSTIEKMLVRDALYKNEITDKVIVSAEKLQKGMTRGRIKIHASYFQSGDSAQIKDIYDRIKISGTSTLKSESQIKSAMKSMEVTFGLLMEDIEDSLYTKKAGEFTAPILTDYGWMVFIVDSLEEIVFTSNSDMEKNLKNSKEIVKNRIEDSIASTYYRNVFSGLYVNADNEIFMTLAGKIAARAYEKENTADGKESVHLDYADFLNIINSYSNYDLKKTFIKFSENPSTLKDFLYEVAFDGLDVSIKNPDAAKSALNRRIKRYIEQEWTARIAFRYGYQNTADNKLYLEMWEDHYLAKAYQREFINSAMPTDDEAMIYYQSGENRTNEHVKIRLMEIFSKDIEVIAIALEELNSGIDFRTLAYKYDRKEKLNLLQDTLLSFMDYGKIGDEALKMEPGQIFGPIENEGGYSIIKLIEKKTETSAIESFEKDKEKIKSMLFNERYTDTLNKMTAAFAEAEGVTVDGKVYKSLQLTEIPMLVFRYFGFGGRMLAVPYNSPLYDWFKEWKNKPADLP